MATSTTAGKSLARKCLESLGFIETTPPNRRELAIKANTLLHEILSGYDALVAVEPEADNIDSSVAGIRCQLIGDTLELTRDGLLMTPYTVTEADLDRLDRVAVYFRNRALIRSFTPDFRGASVSRQRHIAVEAFEYSGVVYPHN